MSVFSYKWASDRVKKEPDYEKGELKVSKICEVTGEEYSVLVPATAVIIFMTTKSHIQDILPHFTPEQREFLISGSTPAEWNEMFGKDEPD
jgi:hypothetical protein